MSQDIETRAGLEIERLEAGVVLLRLARPDRRNAVDVDTARAYTEYLTGANTDSSVRAIVLTGTEKNYCTGADVPPGVPKMSSLDYRYATEDYRSWFKALWEVEKPVISAVNGNVAGAGWMLALLADLVVANADARWTHVFSRRGMVPHVGDPYFLSKIIPFHRLSEIALLSDTLTSADLDKWGLINRCVAADDVLPTALELATRLAAGPTRTLGLTKRLYRRALSTDMATSFEDERNATALISTTKDRVEGVMSFVEGRPANFIGD